MRGGIARTALALAAAILLAGAARAADAPAELFRGKVVTVVIGYSPGGGYDLYARLFARHFGKHLPGRPTVVPQNMDGAGSMKAANYLYAVAPKDGTYIGTFSRSNALAPLFGQARFDSRRFSWIGSITHDVSVCISWHQSAVKTWNDVLQRELIVGGTGVDSDPDMFARLYSNLYGARMRLITGFPGTREVTLAMERREVDGLCGISWSTLKSQHAEWLRSRTIHVLVQAGIRKEPELANVPFASELTRDPEILQVLKLLMSSQAIARPIVAPPGMAADRKAALRAAFDATMKDPAFLAEARRSGLDVNPIAGAQIDALIAAAYATPKTVVTKAARASRN